MKKLFFLLLVLYQSVSSQLAIFYCGFSGNYCGHSSTDDVYDDATHVILAFANTVENGSVVVDFMHYPNSLVRKWKQSGKTVTISVGGQNGNWANVFASQTHISNFIDSLCNIVFGYRLHGVDLNLQNYQTTPRVVADTIKRLKNALNDKIGDNILSVSPEDVTVIQTTAVPGPDTPGQPFNYFVPVINLADQYIDFYQVQAYNNWYDGFQGGSLKYFQDVYLNWRNLRGLSWGKPLQNFNGVSAQKLRLGFMASSSAGISSYYGQPQTVKQFKSFLNQNNYSINGYMIWNTHWDSLNNNAISQACRN